jgi:hypothetical protein
MIIIVAIAAAVVVALFFFLMMRSSRGTITAEPTLQGAVRPGSAEFDQHKANIYLEEPIADEAKRPLGDIVMTLVTTVRNVTGKTLNGLEIRAAVVDHQGQPVKQRTVVVVPTRQAELATNKSIEVRVLLEGMKETDDRADIKMEVTGFKFKE